MKNTLKNDRRCFADIFELTPEHYENTRLTKDIFPNLAVNALDRYRKCYTLCELLYMSPYELFNTENIGMITFNNTIDALLQYTLNHKGDTTAVMPVDFRTGRMFIVLDKILNSVTPTKFDFSEKEQEYISRFERAVQILPNELLYEELNRSSKLIDIDSILLEFYSPVNYIPRLTALIADMKPYLSSKRVYSFARIYFSKFTGRCDFLLKLPKKALINQLDKLIHNPMSDLNTSYSVYCFIKWLASIDLKDFAEKVFTNSKLTERQKDILLRRANGQALSDIGKAYNFKGENTRKIEAQAISRFKKFSAISPDYFICLIYAVKGSRDISKTDIEQYLDHDHTQILWYVLSKGSLDCEKFCYSKVQDIVCFNKEII